MADLQEMLKQAQKLQEEMESTQQRLESTDIEGASGGAAFKITGSSKFISFTLTDDLLRKSKGEIEGAILEAAQDAIAKAKALHEEEMKRITAGLNLPGMGA